MALKGVLDSLDGVDQTIAQFYSKGDDGKYRLSVEGMVDKSKLDEFRDTNVRLMKDIDKFKDVDPVKFRELAEEHRKIQEKEWIEKGELDKVVAQRVATMQTDFSAREKELSTVNESMSKQLESLLIDNEVRSAATKLGIRPSAVDDVLLRAKTVYKVKDGAATPFNDKGEMVYGKDGVNPMAVSEWVGSLKGTAEHLFTPSTGGGANGGVANNNSPNLTSIQKITAGLAVMQK